MRELICTAIQDHVLLEFDYAALPVSHRVALVAALGLQLGVQDRKKLHDLVASAMSRKTPPARVELSPVLDVKVARMNQFTPKLLGVLKGQTWTDVDAKGHRSACARQPTLPAGSHGR